MIMIASLDGSKAIPQSAWIKLAEEAPDELADWSPDGKTLYYTSARDGHTCLWAKTRRSLSPAGWRVVRSAAFSWTGVLSAGGWSAGGGRIALTLADSRKYIWMMSRQSPR